MRRRCQRQSRGRALVHRIRVSPKHFPDVPKMPQMPVRGSVGEGKDIDVSETSTLYKGVSERGAAGAAGELPGGEVPVCCLWWG